MATILFKGYSSVDKKIGSTQLFDLNLAKQDLKNHFYTRQGERVMILSGIAAGQLVANKGAFKLYPGMKVYLASEAAEVAAKAPSTDASAQ